MERVGASEPLFLDFARSFSGPGMRSTKCRLILNYPISCGFMDRALIFQHGARKPSVAATHPELAQ
jgi:hypothetical protein